MWKVYDKTGTKVRCEVRKLRYSGTFMGECFVDTTLYSDAPIDFETGDYFIYRGEPFTINYDPGVLKKAGFMKSGEAYVYDGVKFNGYSDELTRCDFLDYVLSDNFIHFSSLPTFSFFASGIRDLADRIAANLDRVYSGDQKWTVEVHPDYEGVTNVNVDVSKIKVWGALGLIKSTFKANFIIRGRKITIGSAGVPVDHVFEYGKGKGLVEIRRVADSNQQIVTRLRAYGGTKNLPVRYYNKLSDAADSLGAPYLPDNMAVQNLMLPDFPRKTLDVFIDSPNLAALGVREDSVYFDGSDGSLPDIYPSMEGMTVDDLSGAGIHCGVDAGDNGHLDEVAADAMDKDGNRLWDDGTWDWLKKDEKVPPFILTIKDVGFDLNKYLTGEAAAISMKDGMCGGREFEIKTCVKKGNKYVLTCNRVEDEGLNLYFPYRDYRVKAGDKFVLLNIEMPEVYISAASQRLLKAGKEYLAKNDYTRYTYEVKLDEIYMARHPQLYSLLKEGDLMLFTASDFKIDGSIIIDSLRIAEGEGLVPTYEVTLTNEKEVGTLEKIQNAIDSIGGGQGSGGYNAQQISGLIRTFGGKLFLSKNLEDAAAEVITFSKGLAASGRIKAGGGLSVNGGMDTDSLSVSGGLSGRDASFSGDVAVSGGVASLDLVVGGLAKAFDLTVDRTADIMAGVIRSYLSSETFTSGFLGEGFRVWKDGAGLWHGEMDVLTVRKVFAVFEMVVRRAEYQGGMTIRSAAGGKITKVTDGGSHWRCEHDSPDGFRAGDQVFSFRQTGEVKRWWRLVTSAGDGWFNLSKADCEAGSGAPEEGDEMAVLGNRTEVSRQAAQVDCAAGTDAPYRDDYAGIDGYSLAGRLINRTGSLSGITDEDFGMLEGTGQYGRNVYVKGAFRLASSGKMVEDAIADGAAEVKGALEERINNVETRFEVREGVISGKVTEVTEAAGRAATDAGRAATAAANAGTAAGSAATAATNAGSAEAGAKAAETNAAGHAGSAATAASSAATAAANAGNSLAEVTKKESAITQTAGNIALSVEEVRKAAGRAETAESSINLKADGIVIEASKTAATAAVDGMKGAIRRTVEWVDARGLDESKYYPVTIQINKFVQVYTITMGRTLDHSLGVPAWSTHSEGFSLMCKWTVNCYKWGTINVRRTVLDYGYLHSNEIPAGGITQMTNVGYEVIYVRGGSQYQFIVEGDDKYVSVDLRKEDYTMYGQTVVVRESVTAPKVDLELRPTVDEVKSNIKVDAGKITVFSREISMDGKVTFLSLSPDAQGAINGKVDSETIIDGGYIRTSMIAAGSITADKIAAGSITADKIAANAITADMLDVGNGKFGVDKNGALLIEGSSRAPFKAGEYESGSSGDFSVSFPGIQKNNNVVITGASAGWLTSFVIPFTMEYDGFEVTLVNDDFKGATAIGTIHADAPAGKFFYEDGWKWSGLSLRPNTGVRMLGLSDGTGFRGWMVLQRFATTPQDKFRNKPRLVAMGTVLGNPQGASLETSWTFDRTVMSVRRMDRGLYSVSMRGNYYPPLHSYMDCWFEDPKDYMVMLTGYQMVYNENGSMIRDPLSPTKATLALRTVCSFDVAVSDDSTRNDGSFMFEVLNFRDL